MRERELAAQHMALRCLSYLWEETQNGFCLARPDNEPVCCSPHHAATNDCFASHVSQKMGGEVLFCITFSIPLINQGRIF